MASTRSDRDALLARRDLPWPARREALSALYDEWLTGLFPVEHRVALVAVGGLGRREPAPYGDLDLVIVHTGQRFVDTLAEEVWYPIWDAGLTLDHSVRTVDEALSIARTDIRAAVGLLDARHVAGDRDLSAELLTAVRALWRSTVDAWLPQLVAGTEQRWAQRGEVAYLSEPDLKESRGGLRDVQVIRALAAAQIVQPRWARLRPARALLLDVRDALQLGTGRPMSTLVRQEQAGVAAAIGSTDADRLLRDVAVAARAIDYTCAEALRAAQRWRRPVRLRRADVAVRRPLADGVVEQEGEVLLARTADPHGDPVLLLRVAAAAACRGLPVAEVTLDRLAVEAAGLAEPWPEEARNLFVTLLGAGPGLVAVWEALDQHGLAERLLPEWAAVRSRPQRSPVHRFTVDRHLIETVVEVAPFVRDVDRPDRLLLAALLHDVGKGAGAAGVDHSVAGAACVRGIVDRIGLPAPDAAAVVAAVRHHLLLPDTATRRDPDDAATVRLVADAVGGSGRLLDLLHALAKADGKATGPAAWTDWKADQVADLVDRTRRLLQGAPPVPPWQPAPTVLERASAEGTVVAIDGTEVHVATTGGRPMLAAVAGALALHRLDIEWASSTTVGGVAALGMLVRPRFGRLPDPVLLSGDLRRAVAGTLPAAERLAERDRAYRRTDAPSQVPPRVLWFDDAATDATVLELRAADQPGLLHRVAAALEECACDIRSARISTLGSDVVDAFYLAGQPSTPERERIAVTVLAAAAAR